jgi:S1-C subfamily serine protease
MYTGAVLKTGFNNLKILNVGDKSVFSINGEVQFTTDNYRLYGSKTGFIVSGKNSIKIDKLITKEIDVNHKGSQVTENEDQNVKSTGSGIIISKEGYVVTNFHVIEEAKGTLMVEITRDGLTKNYKASIVKSDKENDLAILKIEDTDFNPYTKIQYAFKESGAADVGSTVYTIGFPMALSGMGKEAKFTDGKVSSKTGYNNAINSYQTSVPVQPGNSGGPLFDDKGKLIGVINAKIKDGDNVSYAIKLNYIKNLVELLPESIEFPNDVSTSTLTIQEQVKILSNYVVLIKVK